MALSCRDFSRRKAAWQSLKVAFLTACLAAAQDTSKPGCTIKAHPHESRRNLESTTTGKSIPKRYSQLDLSEFDFVLCQQNFDRDSPISIDLELITKDEENQANLRQRTSEATGLNATKIPQDEFNVVYGPNGEIAGSAHTNDTILYFSTMEDGTVWATEIARKDLPPDEDLNDLDLDLIREDHEEVRALRALKEQEEEQDGSRRDLQENLEIDVMVPYTRRVLCGLSNADSPDKCKVTSARMDIVKMRIDLAIQEANTAFENSGIPGRVRLVHSYLVNDEGDPYYDEQQRSSFSEILNQIGYPTDGILDNMHTERGKYGADVVSFWVANPTSCGLAYAGTPVSSDWAFSVVNYECAVGYYSFVHEIAHHLGAHHDRISKRCPDPFCCPEGGCYSYGHKDPLNRFRSIMANDCFNQSGCPRVLYFSQPERTYNLGREQASVGSASVDNARTIRDQFAAVAAFKATRIINTPITLDVTPVGTNCGNGFCEPRFNENCRTCPQDCVGGFYEGHVCGNRICEATENCENCPSDCPGRLDISNDSMKYCCEGGPVESAGKTVSFGTTCGTGGHPYCKWNVDCSVAPTNTERTSFCCGNGICEKGEGVWNCPVDCGCQNDGVCNRDMEDLSCRDCQLAKPQWCMTDSRFCVGMFPEPCCGACNTKSRRCEGGGS